MSQSLSRILIHLVFSTKDRYPFLYGELGGKTQAYLATMVRGMGGDCYRAGGVADHVHLAVELPRTMTVAKMVESLKSSSSKWIKAQAPEAAKFSWQRGYGAFSVSHSQLQALTDYIDRQAAHHRKQGFQEEYRGLLEKLGVDYDERFLWE